MIQIDMPMPDGCSECRFDTESGFCKAMPDNFLGYTKDYERPEWCPLKEQEPISPYVDSEGTIICGNCGENVGFYPVGCKTPEKFCEYCPECGKAVDWNDVD